MSQQTRYEAFDDEVRAMRFAVRALQGVGGPTEWWIYNRAAVNLPVGHLRVPITEEEALLVPPGLVTMDAGETGPERPRSR